MPCYYTAFSKCSNSREESIYNLSPVKLKGLIFFFCSAFISLVGKPVWAGFLSSYLPNMCLTPFFQKINVKSTEWAKVGLPLFVWKNHTVIIILVLCSHSCKPTSTPPCIVNTRSHEFLLLWLSVLMSTVFNLG